VHLKEIRPAFELIKQRERTKRNLVGITM